MRIWYMMQLTFQVFGNTDFLIYTNKIISYLYDTDLNKSGTLPFSLYQNKF